MADCLRMLLASGYRGAWSIEPHLALRPHESVGHHEPGNGADDQGGQDSFVASGLALEQLVREQVLPAFPAWTAAQGGLIG